MKNGEGWPSRSMRTRRPTRVTIPPARRSRSIPGATTLSIYSEYGSDRPADPADQGGVDPGPLPTSSTTRGGGDPSNWACAMRCCIRIGQRSSSLCRRHQGWGGGRNAGYAAPAKATRDLEARLLAGTLQTCGAMSKASPNCRSPASSAAAWRTKPGSTPRWAEAHAPLAADGPGLYGQAESEPDPARSAGASAQFSVTRDLGAWSLQAGWRQTLSGRGRPSTMAPCWRSDAGSDISTL